MLQLRLHYLFAGLFFACGFFHLVYHLRRKELALLPQKGDLNESWQTIKAMVLRNAEPRHGKFLAEQRLAYVFFFLLSGVLLLSGWLLAYRQLSTQIFHPDLLQLVILLHLSAPTLRLKVGWKSFARLALKKYWCYPCTRNFLTPQQPQ